MFFRWSPGALITGASFALEDARKNAEQYSNHTPLTFAPHPFRGSPVFNPPYFEALNAELRAASIGLNPPRNCGNPL